MTAFLKLFITGTTALALVFALGISAYAQNIEGSAILNADASIDDSVEVELESNLDASVGSDESAPEGIEATSDIQTSEDFHAYAKETLDTNEEIKTVDATDSSVSVGFVEEAKLFGFIPVSLKSRVVVHSDGGVKVVRPWYSVFAIKSDAYQSTELQAEVSGLINSARGKDGNFTAQGKVLVTQAIVGSLVGETQASGNAAGGTVLEGSAPMPGIDVSAQ